MKKSTFTSIIKTLEKRYSVKGWSDDLSPFEVLVGVVLSQATERRNNMIAFNNLRKKFELTPKAIAKADLSEIIESIRPAGLYNSKGPRIKEIAKILLKEHDGDLRKVLKLSLNDAREELMKLPGVGPKTADVVLTFVAKRDMFPVDTHVNRVSKRLGVVGEKVGYEGVRKSLEGITPPKYRRKAHLLLIEHGREICVARIPKCEICPISKYCQYYKNLKLSKRGRSK